MSADPGTLAFYDGNAETYADFSDKTDNIWLTKFMAALPKGGHVLDLGCGIGWAAARMAEDGFEVEAMDASRGLAQVAADRFGLAVTVAPFTELAVRARYDGIWANFCLQHAPRTDRPAIFAAILAALKPGGYFMAGMQAGAADYRDHIGRLYCPFSKADLTGLLAGFDEVTLDAGAGPGFDGKVKDWLRVTARARR